MAPRILFVICDNGFGHRNRCRLVAKTLRAQDPDVRIGVVGWAGDAGLAQGAWEAVWTWPKQVVQIQEDGTFRAEACAGWRAALAVAVDAFQPDLVVSDNLTEALELPLPVVLMGSFLWTDVVPGKLTGPWHASQRRLLASRRPDMLCIGAAAMPSVCGQPGVLRLPWFCDEQPAQRVHRRTVLLAGGGTGRQDPLLRSVAASLRKQFSVRVSERIAASTPDSDEVFPFTSEAFQSVGCMICRPGMGALHDAVTYGIPVVALAEPDNPELVHLGETVEKLGIGVRAGTEWPAARWLSTVAENLDPEAQGTYQRRFASFRRGGHVLAARHLLARSA